MRPTGSRTQATASAARMLAVGLLVGLSRVALAQTQSATQSAEEPPLDVRPVYTVGFAELQAVSVDTRYQYLADSIPLVLRERMQTIADHAVSASERSALQRELIARQVRDQAQKLLQRRAERDEAASRTGAEAAASLQKAVEQIRQAEERIRYLEGLDPEDVVVADRKPVVFWTPSESGAASLLPAPRYSPIQTARANELDLLVFGSIEQVEEYLFLAVKAVDWPDGQIVMDYQDAFLAAEVYAGLGDLEDELAALLLGSPWGSLHVSATPGTASITVDGVYVGSGVADVPYVREGEVKVAATSPGHTAVEQTVTVAAGRAAELAVTLEEIPTVPIRITSDPLLSDVYVDSQWVGRTPVEVRRPVGLARVEVLHAGREEMRLHVSDTSPDVETVVLPPSFWKPEDRQRLARNRFYGALGIAILSIPLPVALLAVSLDYSTAFLQAQAAHQIQDQIDLAVGYRRLYMGYLGGLFLTVSFAVNVVITLIDYIKAADRPAG